MEEDSNRELWKVVSKTIVKREQANSMVISYGKLPPNFEQEIPASGGPPPLSEGKTYLAVAGGTSYVPWARVKFTIKNNAIIELPLKPGELP